MGAGMTMDDINEMLARAIDSIDPGLSPFHDYARGALLFALSEGYDDEGAFALDFRAELDLLLALPVVDTCDTCDVEMDAGDDRQCDACAAGY